MIKNAYDIIDTKIPILNKEPLHNAFSSFLKHTSAFKKQFLQAHFPYAFDGYSFMGQTDSANQYDFDLLNTFVFSDLNPIDYFPDEFKKFRNNYWENLKKKMKEIEQNILSKLEIDGLENFHREKMSYMISCNHYPAVQTENEVLRLSKHKDVSLFTIFPFGIPKGFQYTSSNGEEINYQNNKTIVAFPGYLLEKISKGKVKALHHGVNFKSAQIERYSYAFFSIPKPKTKGVVNEIKIDTEAYFEEYLGLF